jgi:flagellar hook-length control protein FliK
MQPLPITPSAAPVSPQPASGGSGNAAVSAVPQDGGQQGSPSGQPFEAVLARQMAGAESRPAQPAVVPQASGMLLKSLEPAKADDKAAPASTDPVAGAQSGMLALMAMTLVPGQAPPFQTASTPASPQQGDVLQGQGEGAALLPDLQNLSQVALASGVIPAATGDQGQTTVDGKAAFASKLEQAMAKGTDASASADGVGQNGSAAKLPDTPTALQAQIHAPTQPMVPGNIPPAEAKTLLAVNAPVGGNRWGEEFGQKITWMTTQTDHSAELHLNPPDLGPLKVVLQISGDQATALFTSPHAAVRDAVAQALPRLRDMLADNGIMLGNAFVSDQSGNGAQSGFSGSNRRSAGSSGSGAIEVSSTPSGVRGGSIQVSQGLVDTFA